MKTPHKYRVPGLNIGCTSFIIPDYYVPAIRECVHYADDVALLLMEAGECGKELITPAEIRELAGIAADAGVTWNVHLPTEMWIRDRRLVMPSSLLPDMLASLMRMPSTMVRV